jgi:transcriptional regulator with XRE-family HTH domain
MAQVSEYANGTLLRELREQRRTTIQSAAEKMGVSDKSLRLWETRDAPITWRSTEKLAAFYRRKPEELVISAEQRRPEVREAEAAIATGEHAAAATEESAPTTDGSRLPTGSQDQDE